MATSERDEYIRSNIQHLSEKYFAYPGKGTGTGTGTLKQCFLTNLGCYSQYVIHSARNKTSQNSKTSKHEFTS
jgi:hypothetical protein